MLFRSLASLANAALFLFVQPRNLADLGWHVQFNVDGGMIDEMASMLRRLPTPMVFDHLAHPPLPAGIDHSSHKIVRELIDKGRTWVKVSGAYSNSKIGPPSYPEATKIAQAFADKASGAFMTVAEINAAAIPKWMRLLRRYCAGGARADAGRSAERPGRLSAARPVPVTAARAAQAAARAATRSRSA